MNEFGFPTIAVLERVNDASQTRGNKKLMEKKLKRTSCFKSFKSYELVTFCVKKKGKKKKC